MILNQAQTIAMLGVGGTGMKGLAHLLSKTKKIIGADSISLNLPADPNLANATIVTAEEMINWLPKCDLLIYSDAVGPDHSLRKIAQELKLTQLCFNEVVGQLTRLYKTIAITGTHGKSSTTAMLAHIFIANRLDPTVLVGAPVPGWGRLHARRGGSQYFIVEADEYRDHFLSFDPSIIIITAIDFDHPDYFSTIKDVEQSFDRFIKRLKPGGHLITTNQVKANFPDIAWPSNTVAVDNKTIPDISTPLPGQHMRLNATLAAFAAKEEGIAITKSIAALKSFSGLGRRTEYIGKIGQLKIISDYGHHPTEIQATLQGVRDDNQQQRILAIVEIHTLQRLNTFQKEFATALANANGVLFTPVFIPAGRENDNGQANAILNSLSASLNNAGTKSWVSFSLDHTFSLLTKVSASFDLAIIFSAGQADQFFRSKIGA